MSVAIEARSGDDFAEIMALLSDYSEATEKRNVSLADEVFHPNFRVLVVTAEGLREIGKEDYLKALQARKIGGESRQLSVEGFAIAEGFAEVNLKLVGRKMIFSDRLQLLRDKSGWRIINNLTEVKPSGLGDRSRPVPFQGSR